MTPQTPLSKGGAKKASVASIYEIGISALLFLQTELLIAEDLMKLILPQLAARH